MFSPKTPIIIMPLNAMFKIIRRTYIISSLLVLNDINVADHTTLLLIPPTAGLPRSTREVCLEHLNLQIIKNTFAQPPHLFPAALETSSPSRERKKLDASSSSIPSPTEGGGK